MGGFASHGSGDYAVAFSSHPEVRIPHGSRETRRPPVLADDALSPLLLAVVEATEEALLNSLFAAVTTPGRAGRVGEGLPIEQVLELLRARGALR